ncbi:histidine kinase [Reticulibacter mediterranei]|uniref:Histidine kinase n=1 Tax=Reticulibacter mediterranei TaxID=2778369 RepID=A0A8J3IS97_9CHLR|nr:sensor histidine kinase [Reticulibacter mediterranei]GHP01115.1 histidine kinase [Reticulibacter mediterranei]
MKRHIRLLSWFCVFWLGSVIIYWNIWSWNFTSAPVILHILVTLTILIHLGIYWFGFSRETGRAMQWFSLCVQAVLILALTQMTRLAIMPLVLSPLLFIAATVMLKQIRSMLIFLGSFLLSTYLFMQMGGPPRDWSDIWGGGYAPGVGFLGLFFLLILLFYVQQAQQAHEHTLALLHQLDTAHAQLSAYALRAEELTVINERQRIARDLHDTFIQGVTGLVMQLEVVRTQLQRQKVAQAQELLEQVIEAAGDALADARCAIGNLRTGHIRPDDLVEIVQEEISRFTAATDIPCHATIIALANTPAPCCEHVLRAICEGLTNVARHACAETVWMQATCNHEILTVEVRDDGIGFDPETLNTRDGYYGLIGMRERASLIGGHLELISADGVGTTLRLSIPLHCTLPQKSEEEVWLNPFALSSQMII